MKADNVHTIQTATQQNPIKGIESSECLCSRILGIYTNPIEGIESRPVLGESHPHTPFSEPYRGKLEYVILLWIILAWIWFDVCVFRFDL